MHSYMLAEDVMVANQEARRGAFVLEVLRRFTNHAACMKMIVCPDTRDARQIRVRPHDTIRSNLNGFVDNCVRAYLSSRIDLRLWMDDSRRMNHAPKVRQRLPLPS